MYNFDKGATVLGQGCFGTVLKATTKSNGTEVAIKIIDKKKLSHAELENLLRELKIMQNINHPHVVKYLEAYEEKDKLYLVMELCKGGELD